MALFDLSTLNEDYQEAEIPQGLPDGKYQFRIEEITVDGDETKVSIRLHLVVLAGPHRGKKNNFFINIRQDRQRIDWVKKDLLTLGYRGQIGDVLDHLDSFVGLCLNGSLRTQTTSKGTYQNTRLDKVIDPAMVQTDGDVGGYGAPNVDFSPPPEDETPF